MTGTYSLRGITHDDSGDTIVSWDGCIVGVRVSFGEAAAHIVGETRTRLTYCGGDLGAYGQCVRQASHAGDCADAHGHRFAGNLRRSLTIEERALLGVCVDCAGSGVWDDDSTCATCHGWGEPSDDIVAVVDRIDRARAMASHPAGKGRALKIGGSYPRNVAVCGRTSSVTRQEIAELVELVGGDPWNVNGDDGSRIGSDGLTYAPGICDVDNERTLVARHGLSEAGTTFLCGTHSHFA